MYVGRPSPFGNPYTGDGAIAKFRAYLEQSPALMARVRQELRGKHLVCWCAPSPCHADVLLEIANA